MKVLVIGSGAREHALCEAIAKSPELTKLYCAPGNPGIATIAECVPIKNLKRQEIVKFANSNRIDLVIVGPEAPLVDGLVDDLAVVGIRCLGPTKKMARLEGSKSYTKSLCAMLGMPTADWKVQSDPDKALESVAYMAETYGYPIVVKADGVAAGKGVLIAENYWAAVAAIDRIMIKHEFGEEAGKQVVIEEFLKGTEASFFALSDGKHAIPFGTAQDHKKLLDNDLGPNTGGMGAISPAPIMSDALAKDIMERFILPTIKETGFKGILFAGLMITDDGPKLIEYNVRLGDPECQAILRRLQSDILPIFNAAANGDLSSIAQMEWSDQVAVTVVMAAPGYPQAPARGSVIQISETDGIHHAGTKLEGYLVAAGGRVLTITGMGDTNTEARSDAYGKIQNNVYWPEGVYRTDIGG